MQNRKSQETKTEPIIEAAEKAGLRIRGLQSRLSDRAGDNQLKEVLPDQPTDQLEWELQKSFEAEAGVEVSRRFPLNQIRRRVIEGVVEKILSGWEWPKDGKTPSIESEVNEHLIERVFDRLVAGRAEAPGPVRSISTKIGA